jgi:hypothetical protein
MRKSWIAGLAVAAAAVGAAIAGSSCGQTPVNVAIHTFEGAQNIAVLCMNVSDTSKPPVPVSQDNCAPVPANVVGSDLPNHLFALVTQTTRGELAVVDVTAGYVVDEDKSTPGVNFIPVGTNPTDVKVAPDGNTVYVSSAAATKPAIYAIESTRLLGDTTALVSPPLLLTDLTACALPQLPLALSIASLPSGGSTGSDGGDGGRAEGGSGAVDGGDAGAPSGPYTVLALLGGSPAQVVAIDPTSFDKQHGSLPPCIVTGATTLSGALPASWSPGPAWPDGVPYVDGGIDLSASEPPLGPASACPNARSDAGADEAATEGGAAISTGNVLDGGLAMALGPLSAPDPESMVLRADTNVLYVADSALPVIHVLDVSDPTAPHELDPLLATSVTEPNRVISLGKGLALSPPTRDYKRYLYAIDTQGGSLMVFDVTSTTSPRVPMQRPHPELNPLSPPDRLTFASPVVTMAFVQHDWPVQLPNDTIHAYQGLLCNPNPNAHPSSTVFNDLGAYYRGDQASVIQANGTVESLPYRLRGVFGFATLLNGTMVAIDVDDWDAPCRRWDPMSAVETTDPSKMMYPGGLTGALDIPEPSPGAPNSSTYLDPYHAPLTYQSSILESAAVTLEPFFPISAPHRIRSGILIRNDSSGGHVQSISQTPTLEDMNGAPLTTSGQAGVDKPLILPTVLDPGFIDPSQIENPIEADPASRTSFAAVGTFPDPATAPPPGIRLSFDDPTMQQSQNWRVTYEGVLPNSPNTFAYISPTETDPKSPAYFTTLTFTAGGANLCGIGIEDWSLGQARANEALAEMTSVLSKAGFSMKEIESIPGVGPVSKTQPAAQLPTWTADYIEITDDILAQDDQYWSIPSTTNTCWQIPGEGLDNDTKPSIADDRYNSCQAVFGAPGSNPDLSPSRDAPILQAYRDHLVVGRFAFSSQLEQTTNRTIDPGSNNNPRSLKFMQCCFHNGAQFKVRTGGEWVAVGQNGISLLHHVVPQQSNDASENNRCVLSCEPRDALLNSRSFDVPWAVQPVCTPPKTPISLDRNSVLAMRNPFFSYVTWAGCGMLPTTSDHTLTARDLGWNFSINGSFSPLTIALGGTNSTAVRPQSMLFIDSLGQLAVVDGAQQGLVLIDLNTVAYSSNFF